MHAKNIAAKVSDSFQQETQRVIWIRVKSFSHRLPSQSQHGRRRPKPARVPTLMLKSR